MPTSNPLNFSQLSKRSCLLGWMLFHYFQLRHAAGAQFPRSPTLKADLIEELLAPVDLDKPLSTLYGALLCTDIPRMGKLWEYWRGDIPSLDREDWEDSLEQDPKLVISSRDILIKFLHQAYFTPERLKRMFPERDPICSRCKLQPGSYIHMFWE